MSIPCTDNPMNPTGTPLSPIAPCDESRYILRLFVTGSTPRSARAIVNVRRICEENLKDIYDLDVVDISQHPALARSEQILAVPTLIKLSPPPFRRLIGDMSDTRRILDGLGVPNWDARGLSPQPGPPS